MSLAVEELFSRGCFRNTDRILCASSNHKIEDDVLRLEVNCFLGHADRVRERSLDLFESSNDEELSSRCAFTLASQYSGDGELGRSLEWSQKAVDSAEQLRSLSRLSRATCALLERTCDRTAFSASLPPSMTARRLFTELSKRSRHFASGQGSPPKPSH